MKKALIIAVVFIAVTGGVFFLISRGMKQMQANAALTEQLAPSLIERLKDREAADFPYTPAPVRWDGKYLVIEQATNNFSPLNFRYSEELNEKLNTSRFFPGDGINGVVWCYLNFIDVGEYEDGSPATRPYRALFYLDLKQDAVLVRDTIWGGEPPKTISRSDNVGMGKHPTWSEIIEAIRSRTGN